MERRCSLINWSSMDGQDGAFLLLRLQEAVLSYLPEPTAKQRVTLRMALLQHSAKLGIDIIDIEAAECQRQSTAEIIDRANRLSDGAG
jgi:hypothetical protein